MTRAPLLFGAFALAFATATSAQTTTTHTLVIGGTEALGCQGQSNAALLTGGLPVTGQLDFIYDSSTHILTLVVSNTSPVLQRTPNPLITCIGFNLPGGGTIREIVLRSVSGPGGQRPQFSLSSSLTSGLPLGCFGGFDMLLFPTNGIFSGGIANPNATTFSAPTVVFGPVTFQIELHGTGVDYLTARMIALAFSQNAQLQGVNAAFKFERGGPGAAQNGIISSEVVKAGEGCVPNFWITGEPSLGNTFNFCASALAGCHGCMLGSFDPGPTPVGPLVLPIGLPLAFAFGLPVFPTTNAICVPVGLPREPSLVGLTLHITLATVTPGVDAPAVVEFTPRFDMPLLEGRPVDRTFTVPGHTTGKIGDK